jgi:predicted RNA-binding Zn-ribbon protein involved in translation (DUF1610 family)
MTGCPGRDRSSWTHDDIFDVTCRSCGEPVEFFKDDKRRACPNCGACIVNPKQVQSCVDWCSSADKCSLFRDAVTAAPVKEPPPGSAGGS